MIIIKYYSAAVMPRTKHLVPHVYENIFLRYRLH